MKRNSNNKSDGIFNGLNNRQKEAVNATEGKVRAIAGAGAGKTKTLVSRYAHIIQNLGVSPANVLCITFTNKAAQEMKNRVSKLIDSDVATDFICTIHSLCVKILRNEIYHLGYPKNFIILDEIDSKDMAKKVMDELHIDKDDMTEYQLLEKVAEYKSKSSYIGDIVMDKDTMNSNDPVIKYIIEQRKSYYLDFDDLIFFGLYVLQKYKDAYDRWSFFQYIMVDETQDCNAVDWKLINLLGKASGNIFCVGDDCQSIYGFRGSKPQMFVDFKSKKDVVLNQNYRSTKPILDVANCVIKNNERQLKKNLVTERKDGELPVYYHAYTDQDEASWILKEINKLKKSDKRKNTDFAVLYRASYLSRPIEQELLKSNIPYIIWGGVRFYDRKEIKDVMSYLRVIANGDDIAFSRIINVPSRKFGKVSLEKLKILSQKEKTTMYESLKKHIKDKEFNKEQIVKFVELIEWGRAYKDKKHISDILSEVLDKSGLKKLYSNDSDEERIENIGELISSVKDYEKSNEHEEDLGLDRYLQDMSLFTNMDKTSDTDAIKLMTIHQSKGLEFPVVFVCGLNEGIFPNSRAMREMQADGLEEERRIFYVAVTRAMDKLYLSESGGFNFITKRDKEPSRFLEEIDDELITKLNQPKDKFGKNRFGKISFSEANDELSVGDMVKHKFFGTGEIIHYNEKNKSYTVKFDLGVRTVIGTVLEKLD